MRKFEENYKMIDAKIIELNFKNDNKEKKIYLKVLLI